MPELFNVSLKFKSFRFLRFLIISFLLLSVSTLILFLHSPIAHSAQVTLAWNPNSEQDLAGYKIYYGNSSGSYQLSLDVGNTTTCTLSNVEGGKTYYFAATSYDSEGYESDFSDELTYDSPTDCTYSISPISQSFDASGGSGGVSVSTQSGCSWVATSNASWLIITSNSSGTGNGTLYYTVLNNIDLSSRTGALSIASNK